MFVQICQKDFRQYLIAIQESIFHEKNNERMFKAPTVRTQMEQPKAAIVRQHVWLCTYLTCNTYICRENGASLVQHKSVTVTGQVWESFILRYHTQLNANVMSKVFHSTRRASDTYELKCGSHRIAMYRETSRFPTQFVISIDCGHT